MIGMAKADKPPFSAILVWKFSRFARNQEESIVYKSMLKKQCGVDVISVTEPLIEGPFGTLIERIIEWMDEYYSINLSGEVIRGMTEKAMRGGYQSAPCLGYRSPGRGQPFAVVPDEAETVKYIFDQYVYEHRDATAIARSLNEKHLRTKRGGFFEKRSVTYILQNRFYIGKIIWNGIERDGSHEMFISPELFETAQERLQTSRQPKRYRNISACSHYLSGLVKCSVCGASLSFNNGPYPHFQCWKYAKGIHPESMYLSEKVLINSVQEYLESLAGKEALALSRRTIAAKARFDEGALYQKELGKISLRELRIKEAYEAGVDTLDEYRANKKRLDDEKNRLAAYLATAENCAISSQAKSADMPAYIESISGILENNAIDYALKGTFLRSLLEEIIWNRRKNTLTFYLRCPDESRCSDEGRNESGNVSVGFRNKGLHTDS